MRYKIIFILLCFINFGFSQICETRTISNIVMPACNEEEYVLEFEDDFNGNSIDPSKWNTFTGVPRDWAFTQQKAWHTPENLEVSDGTLKIIGKKLESPYTGEWCIDWDPITNECIQTKSSTFNYTSGEIWSNRSFYYGKYEARCRVPNGKGFWPAFWVFGGLSASEIDFFEIYGEDINNYTCNIWNGWKTEVDRYNCPYNQNLPLTFFTSWHTFTCIFDPEKIIFFVDNVPIREYYKYRVNNLTKDPVSCEDEIEPKSYIEQKAWPSENMQLVLNLAIQNGSNGPNSNTIFPGIFEIDYVKFYSKPSPSCVDCISELNFEQTSNLPLVNMTSNLITASNDVVVNDNSSVTFKSKNIELKTGFKALRGSDFLASIQSCEDFNSFSNPILFSHNAIENYQILKCINPIYSFNISGVLNYEVTITKVEDGSLQHSISGIPNSNIIDIWDVTNFANGWYRVEMELKNCLGSDVRMFTLLVENGNCKHTNTIQDSTYFQQNDKSLISVFPNPATNNIIVEFENDNNLNLVNLFICDINGRILSESNIKTFSGLNKYEFDISTFDNGVYFINIQDNFKINKTKFVILK